MTKQTNQFARKLIPALLITAGITLGNLALHAAQVPGVLPPHSKPYGKSYGQWSAAWWQWALSQPLAGHPFIDDPAFNVAAGQSGSVWFLGSPFGTVERTVTIPQGISLFVGPLNAEASDLEGLGSTESEQRDTANFLANHIVNASFTIDGVAIPNMNPYRVSSPQFTFTAPSPWIFGETGGTGTAVADGYFVMLAPLSTGTHTIKFSGGFHFSVAEGDPFDLDLSLDVTCHVTVQ